MYSFIVLFIYVVLSVFIVIMEHAYEEITDERRFKESSFGTDMNGDMKPVSNVGMHSETADLNDAADLDVGNIDSSTGVWRRC